MALKVNKSHSDFWNDQSRFLISYGGAGSGKSFTTGQKLLVRIMSEPNHRGLICRKVARTLRVSVFQLFKDLIASIDMIDDFKINKSDMTITYVPNGSQLLFFGLDDIEKLKSIQGITFIWIEEASECEQNDIAELNRRLRGITSFYKQIILTFNPISHLHWIKEHFFDNPASQAAIYKTTYKDNAFIDEEYKAEIEQIKEFDIQQYNIYALGEWGVLNQNIVYHNYDNQKHVTDKQVEDFGTLHIGIDFNVGGCVGVVCGIVGGVAHVVDGFTAYDTDAIVGELMKYNKHDVILYPDASGKNRTANAPRSSIDILIEAGFEINAPAANGAIRDRVNCMNRLLAMDKMLINDSLERLIYSLQIQAYDKNGKPEKYDHHVKGSIDDWLDALGYFVARRFPLRESAININSVIKF